MNRLLKLIVASAATILTTQVSAVTFQDVWTETSRDPYSTMPTYQTRYSKFFQSGVSLIERAANRTLSSESDILPRFQKLVHPVGICFAGTWSITEQNPYTGYFAPGSRGLIIVRASEALGSPNAGDYRSFGFAGKIFPTMDETASVAKTANFFTVDDLGGTMADSFFDEMKTNEPETSFHLSHLAILSTITEVARTFSRADSNPNIRQVYPISELGLTSPAVARTPHWMAISAETTERVAASDFRDELRLDNYSDGLSFGIYVADQGQGDWRRIGNIKLDREALSDGCDHRLHFPHPRSK